MDEACELPVLGKMCQTIGQQTVQVMTAPFEWLAQMLSQAAAWLFTSMWSVMDSTTLVDLTNPGYLSIFNLIFGLAIVVMLIFFCLQLLTGLIRRDPKALMRAAIGLAKSVLGSFVVVTLTATLLEITDKLSIGIVQATGQTMAGMGDRAAGLTDALAGLAVANPGGGIVLTIILAGLAVAATLVVWFSLLIRKALLLVAVVFAPIALAGYSWDATRGWFGRWASLVIALCCSKLVLVVVFLVAVNRADVPIDKGLETVSEPIAGIALLLVAAFAPYLAYKFISFIGFDISHAMATEQEAKAAVTHPTPLSVVPLAGRARAILAGSGGGTSPAASKAGAAPAALSRPASAEATSTGQGPTSPAAGPASSAADARAVAPVAGGSAGAAGAAAAGGPVGVGVIVAGKAVGALAGIGPRVGRQLADGASDPTEHAAPAQTSSGQPARSPGASSGRGSSNPWLTPRPPQSAVAEPRPPEPTPHAPIPPAPPET